MWHPKNSNGICKRLQGLSDTCVISFIDHYRKLFWNYYPVLSRSGIEVDRPPVSELKSMLSDFSDISLEYGFDLRTCCEPDFWDDGISASSCIDPQRFSDLKGMHLSKQKIRATRKGCRCFESRDIGAYNTCLAECAYCYANSSKTNSSVNYAQVRAENLSLAPLPKDFDHQH